uniref:Helix-hairpin-helix domain-containing protein n=1 Tax=Oscillatoriales cyanobacterium SpSt-402 TaxID=2282168 RepID=A0A832H3E0_9CYAN
MNLRRLLSYVLLAITGTSLMIGIKACSNPTPNQTTSSPASTMSSAIVAGKSKININSAILSELDKLEAQLGIPALSHKIQASRPYASTEELVSKNVVSQDQFNQIKDQITIEEIVLTGEAKDVDYITKLGLMKGHMIVAGELLELKQPAQAEPHLGHPVEEIYVDIEEQLAERQVPEFKQTLIQVQDLVKSKPTDPQVTTAYDKAMTEIDQALVAIPETQRLAPNFVMQVINGLLETATAEYTAAITDGKIKEAIEYQDSRGFVIHAYDLFKTVQPKLKADAKQVEQMNTAFVELQKAWTSPIPPATPTLPPDEVAVKVKQIEQTGTTVANAAS